MKVFLAALLVGLLISYGFAGDGPSLDLLKKSLNKATYSELVLESIPPTSKEVLPDGTMIAYWNDDTYYGGSTYGNVQNSNGSIYGNGGGTLKKFKMCVFSPKGVLVRYKWKSGIWGGDSKEDNDESSSKAKVKPSGSS